MHFEEIYHKYKNDVFNLALHYVLNREDAEEITQDVFLKVHHKLGSFRMNASLKTWIYRITVNQSLDFLKAKNRKKRFFVRNALSDNVLSYEIVNFQHPGIELENKEAYQQLFAAIVKLPSNQRTVITLLKIEHLSIAEVVEIMRIGPKAIESLLQRAKKNLKKQYGQTNEPF
jgi:RNA polymerase sigma-70 factor (ECF subfamily)